MKHPSMAPHKTVPLLAAIAVLGVLTACSPASPTPIEGHPDISSSSPAPSGDSALGELPAEVFAEREAFFDAQGRPEPGQTLTAQTPEQSAFIDDQRALTQAQGIEWSADKEWVALALALDGCETAILNGHRGSAELLQTHTSTSPLFEQIAQGDAQAERGLASVMVRGMSYICSEDGRQWAQFYSAVYG